MDEMDLLAWCAAGPAYQLAKKPRKAHEIDDEG